MADIQNGELLKEIHAQSTRMSTALFGPPGNEKEGFMYRTTEALESHNKRIGDLEKWRSYLAGAWAVVSAFFVKHMFGKG